MKKKKHHKGDPIELERIFLSWKNCLNRKFFEGSILLIKDGPLKGSKGVVVKKDGKLLSSDGVSNSIYKRCFVFFENGMRLLPSPELDEQSSHVGSIHGSALDTIKNVENSVLDPSVPDKRTKFFSLNIST